MNLFEHVDEAVDDMGVDERLAAYTHLLGGLLQQIEDGRTSKAATAAAIDRARAFAIRNRPASAQVGAQA